ncbi:S-adenosyl-L-methionine-dependent methyltransferase [Halteromyces radiatus]|uniref:S-adenosyl-L-methionine-dependent methyltransferase n=1 Tax=Halteromyces radiatus TaxID=101107 RepID=UPI0022208C08|nr:S-adenosyl-L-methionine-dependent methyltransferase [Halteromyces radiatus]KAI8098914.1 S-adenosyl-L-methionine-dependent methyltransferase [Halteromyces radiatus]
MRDLHGRQLVLDENSFLKKVGQKNDALNNQASKRYHSLWNDQGKLKDNDEAVDTRRQQAQSMTNSFYDLVTDFYEYGWGQSFHFAKLYKGDTFEQNINRHEAFLALKLGLNNNMRVLDVGCGVGGPLREIVKSSGGAHVTGINNNAYQIERCLAYSKRYGLSARTDFIKGDFTNMPIEAQTFDAVFSVEATVHAPRLEMVYGEIFRVLKPGGRFACYEWCTTEAYDENDMTQKKIIHAIEQGNSISKLYSTKQCLAALLSVGFKIIEEGDVAVEDRGTLGPFDGAATVPWYYTLSKPDPGLRGLLRSPWGRRYTDTLLTILHKFRMVPSGVLETSQLLNAAADNLVLGGEMGIFTPMFFFLVEKPLE